MPVLKQIALQVPQIRRLWDDRLGLIAERDKLRAEVRAKMSPFFNYNSSFDAIEIMHRYWNKDAASSDHHLTNFLGVKIS